MAHATQPHTAAPTAHAPAHAVGHGQPHPVGHALLDALHAELAHLLAAATRADDGQLAPALAAVQAHLQHHLRQEDQWMETTAFPPRECHRNEHAAVLASVAEVRAALAGGNVATARRLLHELQAWQPAHTQYLDSALAAWLCGRQHGGKPVVLHARPPH